MQPQELDQLARRLVSGELTPVELVRRLSGATIDLDEVQLDVDRRRRCGFPEVIYGEGKSLATLEKIIAALLSEGCEALATRVAADVAAALATRFPTGRYNPLARTLRVSPTDAASRDAVSPSSSSGWLSASAASRVTVSPSAATGCLSASAASRRGHVAVISAGTSDLPVAEEARETADWTGARVTSVTDVGVAGPHRLRERLAEFDAADAIVVVAGMEGALPSVVGGYVPCPVIAVPTSVGYGASFGGLAALLAMLNSCAANVSVVNIDAGFKAGYMAGLIATRAASASRSP